MKPETLIAHLYQPPDDEFTVEGLQPFCWQKMIVLKKKKKKIIDDDDIFKSGQVGYLTKNCRNRKQIEFKPKSKYRPGSRSFKLTYHVFFPSGLLTCY